MAFIKFEAAESEDRKHGERSSGAHKRQGPMKFPRKEGQRAQSHVMYTEKLRTLKKINDT